MGTSRQLRAEDGFTFGAYEALPDGEPIGALVVIQEIFGVNSHIRETTDKFAAAGYASIAPQIFDRVERNVELGYEPEDMKRGMGYAMREPEDLTLTLKDLQATVEEVGKYASRVGVVGYCFGGYLTWLSSSDLVGVDAAVSYYGGGIAFALDRQPKCPVMMHFGELDEHIPKEQVDAVRAKHPAVNVFEYAADHGFNCDHRGSYHEQSARTALERTLGFFGEQLNTN